MLYAGHRQTAPFGKPTYYVDVDADVRNFNLRSAAETVGYDGAAYAIVICTIGAGVVIGSDDETLPSFDTGTFPAGVDLYIYNHGRIAGPGGQGGHGEGNLSEHPDVDGHDGGPAFVATSPCYLDNTDGIMAGGGGGGGGGGNNVSTSSNGRRRRRRSRRRTGSRWSWVSLRHAGNTDRRWRRRRAFMRAGAGYGGDGGEPGQPG